MKHRGFTLIELLVVIAIIAILAAILFPVFAQAKAAAKTTADLSNIKQLCLAHLMYNGDNDDFFAISGPPATGQYEGSITYGTWVTVIAPYCKSIGIFQSALDGRNLMQQGNNPSWFDTTTGGVGVSYAANGYAHSPGSPEYTSSCDCPGKAAATCVLGGVIQPEGWGCDGQGFPGTNYIMPWSKSTTQVTNPASTIMLTDKFNSDVIKAGWVGVGSSTMITNTLEWINGQNSDWMSPGEIPDGNLTATNAYPLGPNGAVSLTTGNKANFAWVDGHAKSMTPSATDPDPVNQPQNNLWDADR
jgi:prepilin-type N-terminal cleavage/methylation domain-containing protein/prepilin-type processing-associated H-X9-DG protein